MKPYLSFVIAARNDDYGGNFLHRMQVFVNVLFWLWERHNLDAELVVVEWNPPKDKPRLKDAIVWPKYLRPATVRIIEVPEDVHRRLPNSDRMPMFEYIAKNVGVRRALGEYVLVTNPDIIFSDSLIKYLSNYILSTHCFYRVDRYDIGKNIPLNIPPDKQLEFCAKHVIQIHRADGSIPATLGKRMWYKLMNWIMRLHPRRLVHGLGRRIQRLLSFEDKYPILTIPQLHTNASGDFILMSKSWWLKLRGFPELPTHSHIDSYMVLLAAFAGLEQVVLKYPIYHQEHDRSAHRMRPLTILMDVPEFREMLKSRRPVTPNQEDWGLGTLSLSEVII
jgi:hypothetical protein